MKREGVTTVIPVREFVIHPASVLLVNTKHVIGTHCGPVIAHRDDYIVRDGEGHTFVIPAESV